MSSRIIPILLILVITLAAASATAQTQQITITGHFMSEDDGVLEPMADINVYLTIYPYEFEYERTEADGSYSFTFDATVTPDEPIGNITAYIDEPGYMPVSPEGWQIEFGWDDGTVFDFIAEKLPRGVAGHVTITCEGNVEPGAGITMYLEDYYGNYEMRSTVTDIDGKYSFEVLEEDYTRGIVSLTPPQDVVCDRPAICKWLAYLPASDIRDFRLKCGVITYTHFWDFEDGYQDWQAIDLAPEYTSGQLEPGDVVDRTHWNWTTRSSDGVWWCGTNSSCLLSTPPGYGPRWDQRLQKEYTLPTGSVSLDFTHQFDTEAPYDICSVDVSNDGGDTFNMLNEYAGDSEGYVPGNCDLSAFAGSDVIIRFRFTSDGGWDDADGNHPTNGAWCITALQVTGHVLEGFDASTHGWAALPAPTSTTAFDLGSRTIPDKYGQFWKADDDILGYVPPNYDPTVIGNPPIYPDLIARGGFNQMGIESPWINWPMDAEDIQFGICLNLDRFGFNHNHFLLYQMVFEDPDGCEQVIDDNTYHHFSSSTSGWVSKMVGNPWRNLLSGTQHSERIKLRIIYVDLNGIPYRPIPTSPTGAKANLTRAPYFDNVIIAALNTAWPSVDYLPADMTCPCECSLGGPTVISISGTVTSDCVENLEGFPVDLILPDGDSITMYTDEAGEYVFEGLTTSTEPGDVTLVTPLGTVCAAPVDGHQAVDLTADQTGIDFALDCFVPTLPTQGGGYWKHQVNTHLKGKPHGWQETLEDMSVNFPLLIFDHFHENQLNGIAVAGVTFIGDESDPQPVTLESMQSTLTVNNGGTMNDRAKQHYLALLLNLASLKLTPSLVVSEDGHTASQAVQECAHLILDDDASNDERAKDIAEVINDAGLVATGLILGDWDNIAYRPGFPSVPRSYMLAQNEPNPFNPMTTIRFAVPKPTSVLLTVHDIMGRRVVTLVNGHHEIGEHSVVWNGTNDQRTRVPSGVYFLHMSTPEYSTSRKMSLLK